MTRNGTVSYNLGSTFHRVIPSAPVDHTWVVTCSLVSL